MNESTQAAFLSDASQDADAAKRICEALHAAEKFQQLMKDAEARADAQPRPKK